MAYTTLYRKWRPQNFDQVRGQESVIKALRSQIVNDRVGHAYLFCGTRGTGKTSVAKILARAINCENPVNGNPCNECATCKSILSGSSMNVVEIDAASNNGVDNIREIREEVRYSPTSGKYRVYIIDEVHMLSPGAHNALLKTLEEPPSYVVFILATTEAHKIPITVQSRCQRYDFRRIGTETLQSQLENLTEAEGISIEKKGLRFIAKTADGSMRDALSLLEECAAFYQGDTLTYDNILDVLGAVDTTVFSRLLQAVLRADVSECIHLLDDLMAQGRNLTQFVTEMIWYLRNLLLLQTGSADEDVFEMSAENLAVLKKEARQLEMGTLMRYIRILSELSVQMKQSSSGRVLLEVAVIRMMQPEMERDTASLEVRLSRLESAVAGFGEGTFVPASSGRTSEEQKNRPAQAGMAQNSSDTVQAEPVTVEVSPAVYEDFSMIQKNWDLIIHDQEPLITGFLKVCTPSYSQEHGYEIICPSSLCYMALRDPEYVKLLSESVEKRLHKAITFTLRERGKAEAESRIVPAGGQVPGIQIEIGEE